MTRIAHLLTVTLGLSSLALSFSAPALAQPARCQEPASPPSTPELNAKIKRFYDDGVAATKREDWKTAHARFLEAWKLNNKHVQIAANLGWAEFQLGMYRDAAEHLNYFLKATPTTADQADRKHIQAMFDQVRKRVGELKVKVNIHGAWVFLDKRPLGCSPMKIPVFVEAGPHLLEARIDGYATAKSSIDVNEGAGLRTVELKLVEGGSGEEARDEKVAVKIEKPKGGTNKVVMYSGLGLTGAAAIVTGVFAGFAISQRLEHSRLYNDFNDCVSKNNEADCRNEMKNVSNKWAFNANVALGAGIVTGILGASVFSYWYAMRTPSGQKNTTAVGINAGPGGIDANVVVLW